ncbi:aspartate carbamoyltransferase catalytic subunit [Legionella israelensis]|uniref:Aspartate carbamoyltransferase n=1 Tax=Legionella israelensis TaxID=454 RepID=A0A0W0V2F6_9GAMM|nr:aspartate carbamoyltransferase catalytic subunit [Legionella israelensis]KTD14289.1 aspartate carbamoyltransferase [Legionella israelensis]QBS10554.1 aspartate carbamoyltransferase catalytic subunit [Legionella israelensis]SCX93953.1 aspartate carbamoyltransferase [Legionella israelensis DSM 19235]STX57494.1 aspartate carbamoyltransferase [Legionella israelensis]
MKHFLEISQIPGDEIENCIQRALYFKRNSLYPVYPQYTVAHLFYENSTRTRVSFEVAAHRLSMPVINLDVQHSSESKGEIIEDTILNLSAMGIYHFVIRHSQDGLHNQLATKLNGNVHLINAGDGKHAHPSQAMLDLVTIVEQKPHLPKLKMVIIGNIRHSRVANSLQCICKALGVGELAMVAPKLWQPETVHYGYVTDKISEALIDADVIVCLRVQKERLSQHEQFDLAIFQRDFKLSKERLAIAKPEAMVLHPGPVNRGIEIDSDVADGPQSFILQQVTNGVYTRMAILEALIGGIKK